MLITKIDQIINQLSIIVGLNPAIAKTFIIILIVPLLSIPLRFLARPIRYFYSIPMSIFICYLQYYDETITIYLIVGISYLLIKYVERRVNHITFIVVFGYLLCYHLYKYIYHYKVWRVDASGTIMMIIINIHSLACNYVDGHKHNNQLSNYQIDRKLQQMPSFIDYFEFCTFLPCISVGPGLQYIDWHKYNSHNTSFPNPIKYIFKMYLVGIFYAALGEILNSLIPRSYVLTQQYKNSSFFHRTFVMILVFEEQLKCKYYCGWSLSKAGLAASGLSFNGYDDNKQSKWDLVDPIKIWNVETATSLRVTMVNWNHQTHLWLKHYIYFRICPEKQLQTNKSKSMFAEIITYIVSAIWHGFYPGYYISFIGIALINQTVKKVYRNRHLFTFIPQQLRLIIAIFLNRLQAAYFFSGFDLLEVDKILTFYQNAGIEFIYIIAFINLAFFIQELFAKREKKKSL